MDPQVYGYTIERNVEGNFKTKTLFSHVAPYCGTKFAIFSDYVIVQRQHAGTTTKVITIAEDAYQSGKYSPLEKRLDQSLDTALANIRLDEEESILSFCKTFGLLGANFRTNQLYSHESTFYSDLYYLDDDYCAFKDKVAEFQMAFKIWHGISRNDKDSIRQCIESFNVRWGDLFMKNITAVLENFDFDETILPYKTWRKLSDDKGEAALIATGYLSLLINNGMRGIIQQTQLIKAKIVPAIYFATPLDAAWWQFAQQVNKDSSLGYMPCKYCGSFFVPIRKGQSFCPNPKGRSSCERNYAKQNRTSKKVK